MLHAEQEAVGLKERIIAAAGKIFAEEGYDNLSMRRVAQVVGCSQMAAYRHFANKEALTQYLCAEIYTDFTGRMFRHLARAEDAWQKITVFVTSLIDFAVAYPDHYSLVFLVRNSDPAVISEREQLGHQFLEDIHMLVRQVLSAETSQAYSRMRLRQVMTLLHGTAALLIAHPKAYGLTRAGAVRDAEDAVKSILK